MGQYHKEVVLLSNTAHACMYAKRHACIQRVCNIQNRKMLALCMHHYHLNTYIFSHTDIHNVINKVHVFVKMCNLDILLFDIFLIFIIYSLLKKQLKQKHRNQWGT